jgi:hypothetical protein
LIAFSLKFNKLTGIQRLRFSLSVFVPAFTLAVFFVPFIFVFHFFDGHKSPPIPPK